MAGKPLPELAAGLSSRTLRGDPALNKLGHGLLKSMHNAR
jgi:hypothetical protein